jgi:hypothetical protein
MPHRCTIVGWFTHLAAGVARRALGLALVLASAASFDATQVGAASVREPSPAADANDRWWGALAQPGTDAMVSAMTVFEGNLILSGSFGRAGGVAVNRVVMWDGGGWRKIGNGLTESAPASCIYKGQLVVGGSRWDGTAWQPLGPGIHGVYALATYGNDLVAGGTFTQVGGTPASYIARWDGVAWHALGLGVNALVRALAVYRGELIAAGDFTTAGGIAAAHIARWNGSQWQPLGTGTSAAIYALLLHGSDLVAGGGFGYAGSALASRVARWDGTRWSSFGAGRPAPVLALSEYAGNIVCGGNAVDVASWNGTDWVSIPVPLLGVRCLLEFGGELIAGGTFDEIAGLEVNNLARWDGAAWRPLHALGIAGAPGSTDVAVRALTVWDGEVVAGGEFARAGGVACTRIAAWNGGVWHPLGAGLDGTVDALVVHQGKLFAGGSFTHAGTTSLLRLARWNGSDWSAVGLGVSAPVHALLSWGTDLIVGGEFVVAGTVDANRIARWDGTNWGTYGLGMDGAVRALAIFRDSLVAGGEFRWASGNPVHGIARWDGNEWQNLGQGVSRVAGLATVNALAVYGGELVAGGQFDYVGSTIRARGMGRWNGIGWSAFAEGAGGTVYTLAVNGSDLYAGGTVDLGCCLSGGLLRWSGSAWDSLGTGLGTNYGSRDGIAQALLVNGPRLWVGGKFVNAGRKSASYVARWTLDTTPVAVEDLAVASAADGVHLAWRLAGDGPQALAGVRVERAEQAAGPYADISVAPLAPAVHMHFDDATVDPGHVYWYRLQLVGPDGGTLSTPPVRITAFAGAAPTALLDARQPPSGGPAVIRFSLGSEARYRLVLYDARGRQVRALAAGPGVRGENVRSWDLRDEAGRPAGRGVYFVRLTAGGVNSTRKLALLRR